MSVDYILLYSSVRWTILSLRKMRKFQLISRSPENLQKRCFFWKFPHREIRWNFRILCIVYSHMGEIIWATKNKKCYETLSPTIRLRCESFASHCSRRLDQLVSPFFHRRSSFYRKMFESSTPIQNQPCSPSVKGCISIMWMEAQSSKINSIRYYCLRESLLHRNNMQSILAG